MNLMLAYLGFILAGFGGVVLLFPEFERVLTFGPYPVSLSGTLFALAVLALFLAGITTFTSKFFSIDTRKKK